MPTWLGVGLALRVDDLFDFAEGLHARQHLGQARIGLPFFLDRGDEFAILQLDLWGAREVTDFDGARMTEKALAERWGISFSPTIVFFKDELTGLDGKWGRELEAVERLALSFGHDTFYDLFVWVRQKVYERDGNFQRFHIARSAERAAMKAEAERVGSN